MYALYRRFELKYVELGFNHLRETQIIASARRRPLGNRTAAVRVGVGSQARGAPRRIVMEERVVSTAVQTDFRMPGEFLRLSFFLRTHEKR